jgi:hypothetical protein
MVRNARLTLSLIGLSMILAAGAILVWNLAARDLRQWMTPVLADASVLVHIVGLASWAHRKGRNPLWALLGVGLVGPLGLLVILALDDLGGSE